MDTKTGKQELRGIIPPMVTPLLENGELDVEGVGNLVEHLIKGGVSGIFILGTTGETQHLSFKTRKELIKKTCEFTAGRAPVLVGITDTSLCESLDLAALSADCKAFAAVAAPPYYYALGQPELIEYYEALADRSALPLYLYNMPSHTKVMIEPETVLTLSGHGRILGLKDSSANSVYFHKLLYLIRSRPDFGLFVGPEEMMASVVLMGAHGGITGGANLYPNLFVNLYHAALNRNMEQVAALQEKIMAVGNELYSIGRFGSSYIKGLKTALALKGICGSSLAIPFNRFREPEQGRVKQALAHLEKIIEES
jgi:4-hydroxy-tetrahydrodipicolinate synthase